MPRRCAYGEPVQSRLKCSCDLCAFEVSEKTRVQLDSLIAASVIKLRCALRVFPSTTLAAGLGMIASGVIKSRCALRLRF